MTMLKRQYATDAATPTHVRVMHTGSTPEQNYSHRMVEQAMVDGWMRRDGDTLIVAAEPEDLRYDIKREPGYYCASSGERIPISPTAWARMKATGKGDLTAKEAKAWLAARGLAEGDYTVTNAYECALDPEQHARFQTTTETTEA